MLKKYSIIHFTVIVLFSFIFLNVLFSFAAEERITLTTYYPAPYGIYNDMRTDTLAVGSAYRYTTGLTNGTLVVADKVGIGTSTITSGSRLEIKAQAANSYPFIIKSSGSTAPVNPPRDIFKIGSINPNPSSCMGSNCDVGELGLYSSSERIHLTADGTSYFTGGPVGINATTTGDNIFNVYGKARIGSDVLRGGSLYYDYITFDGADIYAHTGLSGAKKSLELQSIWGLTNTGDTYINRYTGSVGIGLPPSVAVDSKLTIGAGNTDSDGNPYLVFKSNQSEDIVFKQLNGTQRARIWSPSGGPASSGLSLGVENDNRLGIYIRPIGYVGIRTSNPTAELEVNGQVKITGGQPGDGKILTSDANGLGSWQKGINIGIKRGGTDCTAKGLQTCSLSCNQIGCDSSYQIISGGCSYPGDNREEFFETSNRGSSTTWYCSGGKGDTGKATMTVYITCAQIK